MRKVDFRRTYRAGYHLNRERLIHLYLLEKTKMMSNILLMVLWVRNRITGIIHFLYVVYIFKLKLHLFIWEAKGQREMDKYREWARIHWFTSNTPAMAGAGPDPRWEAHNSIQVMHVGGRKPIHESPPSLLGAQGQEAGIGSCILWCRWVLGVLTRVLTTRLYAHPGLHFHKDILTEKK